MAQHLPPLEAWPGLYPRALKLESPALARSRRAQRKGLNVKMLEQLQKPEVAGHTCPGDLVLDLKRLPDWQSMVSRFMVMRDCIPQPLLCWNVKLLNVPCNLSPELWFSLLVSMEPPVLLKHPASVRPSRVESCGCCVELVVLDSLSVVSLIMNLHGRAFDPGTPADVPALRWPGHHQTGHIQDCSVSTMTSVIVIPGMISQDRAVLATGSLVKSKADLLLFWHLHIHEPWMPEVFVPDDLLVLDSQTHLFTWKGHAGYLDPACSNRADIPVYDGVSSMPFLAQQVLEDRFKLMPSLSAAGPGGPAGSSSAASAATQAWVPDVRPGAGVPAAPAKTHVPTAYEMCNHVMLTCRDHECGAEGRRRFINRLRLDLSSCKRAEGMPTLEASEPFNQLHPLIPVGSLIRSCKEDDIADVQLEEDWANLHKGFNTAGPAGRFGTFWNLELSIQAPKANPVAQPVANANPVERPATANPVVQPPKAGPVTQSAAKPHAWPYPPPLPPVLAKPPPASYTTAGTPADDPRAQVGQAGAKPPPRPWLGPTSVAPAKAIPASEIPVPVPRWASRFDCGDVSEGSAASSRPCYSFAGSAQSRKVPSPPPRPPPPPLPDPVAFELATMASPREVIPLPDGRLQEQEGPEPRAEPQPNIAAAPDTNTNRTPDVTLVVPGQTSHDSDSEEIFPAPLVCPPPPSSVPVPALQPKQASSVLMWGHGLSGCP